MMTFCGHIGAALITAGLLRLNPVITIIGAVIPDLDSLIFLTGRHWRDYHRKFTHSLLFLFITLFISIPLFYGVLSHIITDIFLYPGVALFHPFSEKKFPKFKKRPIQDTPITAVKNWFHDTKEIIIESIILIMGLTVFL